MGSLQVAKVLFRPFLLGILVGIFAVHGALVFTGSGIGQFILTAYASSATTQPIANGLTNQGALTTCGTANAYDCLNDGVTSPTAPSTSGDYITWTNGQSDFLQMGTVSNVSSVTQIDVPVYHIDGGTNMQLDVSLWDSTETVQYGTTQTLTNRTASSWDTASFTGLALTQTQINNLHVRLHCNRPGGGKATNCIGYAMYANVTYTPVINVTVSSLGSMRNLSIATTSAYIGGTYVIKENTSSRNITSITLTENGSVNAQTNISNLKLKYDLDTTSPYDCNSESYSGSESQFGSTASSFTSANGTVTFTGSVPITTTSIMCAYLIADVGSGAGIGETFHPMINNPSTDVVGSGSAVVSPSTIVAPSGTSTLQRADLRQAHYHWRNDDGSESGATSATGGTQDTSYDVFPSGVTKRLRIEVNNAGNITSATTTYRIEYATKVTTCSAASGWTDVGAAGGAWDMAGSGSQLSEGSNTTNIATSIGGVSDANTTFVGTGGQKETSSQTTGIALTNSQYYEMEFAVVASTTALNGTSYCFRVTNAGTAINAYDVYPVATIGADVFVSATSTQATNVNIPKTGAYGGGAFVMQVNVAGAKTITSVKITATGTVDVQNNIKNVKLLYDVDTTAPYDCTGESYSGSETQYGSTVTGGFNGSKQATFTGSVTASSTRGVCFYVTYDVQSGATNGQTIGMRIANPGTDVVLGSGTVSPTSLVSISGLTTLVSSVATEAHYHWRNNDGGEATSTSATNGAPDTTLTEAAQLTPYRIRIGIENTGGTSTGPYQYRLESAQRVSTCAAATGWTDVGSSGGDFDIAPSLLVDGGNTTDIATSTGGFSNNGYTFLTPNGGQKDASSQTGAISLPSHDIVELEYAVKATASSTQGATYCFRVTNAGTPLTTYSQYPKITVKLGTDFAVYRGQSTIPALSSSVTITNGVDYTLQKNDATRAFIRITNSAMTGAGPGSIGNHNASDITAYISNPGNITSSITFTRATTNSTSLISWEIVEYIGASGGENEIKVRSANTFTYTTTALQATTSTISGIVNDAQVVPFITGQGNPDGGRFNYNTTLSVSSWNSGAHTATFTRGEAGSDAVNVSYAIVEFTGANWKIQRVSHAYTNVGTLESQSITAVNSISRTFLHVQNMVGTGLDTHADFGHQVYLSGIGTVQFRLDAAAGTPASGHISVAWVIENTQSTGKTMHVWRSNGTIGSSGTAPAIAHPSIGTTLTDLSIASIFVNDSANSANRTFQEPIISARLMNSSTTAYELWVGDPSDSISYRTEVVEWPTAASKIYQNYYRFYVDNDALKPTDPWPSGAANMSENAEMTALDGPIANGQKIRLRMSLNVTSAILPANIDAFTLQYAKRVSTCSAIADASWSDLGDSSSSTAIWRGNAATPADGTALSGNPPTSGDLLLSVSDIAGTYEENNNTALVPYNVAVGNDIEYDWNIQDNGASDKTSYCFRMIESTGSDFTGYNFYPVIRTVGYEPKVGDWRFYDDETNLTPTSPLAATDTAPINIANKNILKLRVVVKEVSGAAGPKVKFKLQASEYPDFSKAVFDVVATSSCAANSLWCYANGAGTDNATITQKVIGTADACSGGVGAGCGTYNEGTATSTAKLTQGALKKTEFEFTIKQAGARANAVYYFRLYDEQNNAVVVASSSYPSVVTEGASLVFSVSGLPAGTSTEGVVTDVSSTASAITFGSVPFNTPYTVAHRLSVNTNATQGYQLLMYADQQLLNSYGTPIPPVSGTNASPTGWSTGCSGTATGCFGYHAGDDSLAGGSSRFAPNDSYAALSTTPKEVMYSSIPTNDVSDVVYKLLVREGQPAGTYNAVVSYIAIPVF